MVMIDWNAYGEKVLFDIRHYGTKTKGEEFRQDQVAAHITEMTEQLLNAYLAADKDQSPTEMIFKIGPA